MGTSKPWFPYGSPTSTCPSGSSGNSSGPPNGSAAPCTTSVGNPDSSSSSPRLLSGLPGGCSGNASATTPTAPLAAPVRHATRAPALRPPTTSGSPCPASRSATGRQPRSSVLGAGPSFFPATRQGCSTSATVIPRSGSRPANATRSRAPIPPPAPCPSASTAFAASAR